jgi:2',3'-cyclic-nucleotide 2'-phosphodiesterase (5'-nucleotidase family)
MQRLRIVAINDVYTLENLPRFKTLVAHHRRVDPADAMLVTVAGDFLAPSLLSSLDSGAAMVACLNAIGVTHVTFGNHEDDIDVGQLRARAAELHAKWLATNVRGLSFELPASDVIDVGAARVGLVGVVMNAPGVYRRMPFGATAVDPPNEAARREAERLVRERGCACVVPLTHQDADDDRALARLVREPPFPVIIAGHEHTPLLEQVEGTWIVKAGMDATHAVVVDLELDAGGAEPARVTTRVRLEPVSDYPEDLAMRARIDVYMRKVHALEEAPLLFLPPGETLSSVGTRARPASFATFVCSRLRDALDADACLFNGGGIRASREYAGRVTYGDLKAEMPFDNEIVVQPLPGRVVRDAVAASRARAPLESGGYLQVDDRAAVEEPAHALVRLGGAPLDPERVYRVALVREMLFGLDHNQPLVDFARAFPERVVPVGSGREAKVVLVDGFAMALWDSLGGFDAVDANHDGVVTEPEVEAAFARTTHGAPSPVTADLVIRSLDQDHDAVVSRCDEAQTKAGHGPKQEP